MPAWAMAATRMGCRELHVALHILKHLMAQQFDGLFCAAGLDVCSRSKSMKQV